LLGCWVAESLWCEAKDSAAVEELKQANRSLESRMDVRRGDYSSAFTQTSFGSRRTWRV